MTSIARESLATPSTWHGPELSTHADWIRRLSDEQVDDLENALLVAKTTGKSMTELTREDFPLPGLAPAIGEWMEALQNGRGFINVKGIPVDRHDDEEIALIHWGLGLHMGTAVSQNAAGDLLGHVRDTGADPLDTGVRLYKTRVDLGFHKRDINAWVHEVRVDFLGCKGRHKGNRVARTHLPSQETFFSQLQGNLEQTVGDRNPIKLGGGEFLYANELHN